MDFDDIEEIIEELRAINPWIMDEQTVYDKIQKLISELEEKLY